MEGMQLTPEQIDVLKEIGTVGSGSAATALSQMLRKKVSIQVPQIAVMPQEAVSSRDFAFLAAEVGLAVEFNILGEIRGGMLVLFSQQSAMTMIDVLMKRPAGSTQLLNLLEASALSETSHILSGAYLNAVGQLLDLHQTMLSIPQTTVDRLDRLNRLLIRRFADEGINYLLPIENKLKLEGVEVDAFVVFLLEQESVSKILSRIGL